MILPFQMKLFLAYCYFPSIQFLLVQSWIDNFTFYGQIDYRDSKTTWLPNTSSLADSLVRTLDKLRPYLSSLTPTENDSRRRRYHHNQCLHLVVFLSDNTLSSSTVFTKPLSDCTIPLALQE
jgi:hypothetical protein